MMRSTPLFLLLGVSMWAAAPFHALAQQPPGFDPTKMMERLQDPAAMEAMQKMAAQAQAAGECMKEIDEGKLEALRKRAEETSKEIERLCAAGKKDEALAKGLAMSRELSADATVKKMRECSKELTDSMGEMPWAQMTGIEDLQNEEEPTRGDICS